MKRHDTDAVSLGFGLAFLGFAAWWQVIALIRLRPPGFGWFVAFGLILFGVLGLLGSVRAAHRHPDAG